MEKRENTSKKDKVAKNAFYCLYPEAITACKLYSSKRGCMRKTECAICFWLDHKIITLNIIFTNSKIPGESLEPIPVSRINMRWFCYRLLSTKTGKAK